MRWLIGIDLVASHHEFGVAVSLLGVSHELQSFLPSRSSKQPESVPRHVILFTEDPQIKIRKSVRFKRNTNEINQSDAKTDAPKTVSYSKQKNWATPSPANWYSETVMQCAALPSCEKILGIFKEGS
jgi:hypothetical protein